MELTKDVTIDGKEYQIGKLSARDGSWIAMQILTKLMPGMIEGQIGVAGLPAGRSEMSEQEFHNIQDHCLAVCRRYTVVGAQRVAEPVMPQPGKWAFKDLEFDLIAVLGLTINVLIFNVSPFFDGDGLKSLLGTMPDILPSIPSQ